MSMSDFGIDLKTAWEKVTLDPEVKRLIGIPPINCDHVTNKSTLDSLHRMLLAKIAEQDKRIKEQDEKITELLNQLELLIENIDDQLT